VCVHVCMCFHQILPIEGSTEAHNLKIMEYIFTILFSVELCVNLFGSLYVLVSFPESDVHVQSCLNFGVFFGFQRYLYGNFVYICICSTSIYHYYLMLICK